MSDQRTLKTPHYKLAAMMIISFRIHDILANIFEKKSTISCFNATIKPQRQRQ